MKLSYIINELSQHVQIFSGRVSGVIDFTLVPKTSEQLVPSAYVMPLFDESEKNKSSNDYWQVNTEQFAVIVVLPTESITAQLISYDQIELIKIELWKILLGLEIASDYYPIEYAGAHLVSVESGLIFYQFNFKAKREIQFEMTRHYQELQGLLSDGVQKNKISNFDSMVATFHVDGGESNVMIDLQNLHGDSNEGKTP